MKEYRIEIKWAVIYAVVMLLWTLAERLTGQHDKYIGMQQNISLLIFIPVIVIYVLAILEKKRKVYKGVMTYVQGFLCGIGLTVGILVLTPVFQFISYYIISPHYFENLISYSVSNGILSHEAAKGQFTYGNFVFTNMVVEMITGVVFAAFIPIWAKSGVVYDEVL